MFSIENSNDKQMHFFQKFGRISQNLITGVETKMRLKGVKGCFICIISTWYKETGFMRKQLNELK